MSVNIIELTGRLTSDQATKFIRQFPPNSEPRQTIESLKQIRHVGDAIALEIFVKTMNFVIKQADDGQQPNQ
jgi:hypothetical protein